MGIRYSRDYVSRVQFTESERRDDAKRERIDDREIKKEPKEEKREKEQREERKENE